MARINTATQAMSCKGSQKRPETQESAARLSATGKLVRSHLSRRSNQPSPNLRIISRSEMTNVQNKLPPLVAGIPHAEPQCLTSRPLPPAHENEAGGNASISLVITLHRSRLLDADNAAGSCKPIIDSLRYARIIPEDNPQAIKLEVRQVKVKAKNEGTEIQVTNKNE